MTVEQPMKAQRGVEILPYSFFNLAAGWGVWLTPHSSRFSTGTRYPLYRSLGGPQGRSGRVRKILFTPGFDPRTVQSVAIRYTEYTIPTRRAFAKRFKKRVLFEVQVWASAVDLGHGELCINFVGLCTLKADSHIACRAHAVR